MTDQGLALLVFFVAFALFIPVLSWDAGHGCDAPKCPHRKED